jgi:hypothetical protein
VSRAEKALTILLRITAVVMILAVVAVFLPFDTMALIHRWLDLGEMPREPIVHYLARSASALYVLLGVQTFYVSLDVRRYLLLIRFSCLVSVVFGVVLLFIDWAAGMPVYWLVGDGPMVIVLFGVIGWLAYRVSDSN